MPSILQRATYLGRSFPRLVAAALLVVLPAGAGPVPSPAASPQPPEPPAMLAVVGRATEQDQGGWLVTYRLRYQGTEGLIVTPSEIVAKVEGWLSNSRVSAHAVPRWSSAVVSGGGGMAGVSEIIAAADDARRCRERVVVQVWTDDPTSAGLDGHKEPSPPPPPPPASTNGQPAPVDPPPILSLAPGASVRVRLRLEHLHAIVGDYDPLLGARTVEIQLGSASFRDVVPLDREQYVAQARNTWPAPPDDRRDPRIYRTAPDSLVLEAHIPGNQYYRFPDRPVRYGQLMRLRFWYLVAAGTEGDCYAHLTQCKSLPTQWKLLSDGAFELKLETVGRWVKVEKTFRTECEATLVALDFRVTGDVGQMWIDDVSLEPIGQASPAGP